MGLMDKIKDIMSIPEEDDYEEEQQTAVAPQKRPEEETRHQETPRVLGGGRAKTAQPQTTKPAIQVVLVKPERFDDVLAIADHLNEGKTVVLNLESAERDVPRRIVDFISGVAYANHGNIRKVANNTYIVVSSQVDVMGELMLDDYGDTDKLYF